MPLDLPLDTWLIFRHQLRLTMGGKAGMVFGVLQPVLNLALFGPLLSTYLGSGSRQVFVPGVLVRLALLSAGLAGFSSVFDAPFGVLERQRVSPAGRIALLLGQSALVVAVGFAFGFRVPVAGLLLGLALLVPLAVTRPAGGLHRPLRLGRRGRRCRGVPGVRGDRGDHLHLDLHAPSRVTPAVSKTGT